jgi:segregation and condensation protein B
MTDRAEMEAVIEAVLFVASEPVSRSRLVELFDEEEREEAAAALAAVLARYGGTRAAGEPAAGGNGSAPGAEAAVLQPDLFAAGEETAEPAAEPLAQPADAAEPPAPAAEDVEEPAPAPEREGILRGIMVEEVAGGVRLVTRPEMVGWLRRFFDVAGGSKLSMAALETLAIIAYRQPITGPEIQELRSVSPAGVIKTLLERRMVRIAGRKEVVGKPFLYATTREFLIHFGLKSLKDLPPLEDFEETFGGLAEGGGVEPLAGRGDREEEILAEVAALDEAQAAAAESAEAEAIEAIRGRYEPAAWPSVPDMPDVPLAPLALNAAAEDGEEGSEDEALLAEGDEAELLIAGEEGEG